MSASSLLLEKTACVICGSQSALEEARIKDDIYASCPDIFTVVRCSQCEHLYLNPRPTPEMAKVIYPPHYITLASQNETSTSALRKIKNYIISRRLKAFGERLGPDCSLLDVGCGDGDLLLSLREMHPSLKLAGLDLQFTDKTLQKLQEHRINTVIGSLETAKLSEESFDIIIMNQLIEHLWNPTEGLRKVFQALRYGGILSIETINAKGYDRKLFNRGIWGGYYAPRHLNFFSFGSLSQLLGRIGFRVRSFTPLLAPVVWAYSMRSFFIAKNPPMYRLAAIIGGLNPLTLGLYSVIDLIALAGGRATSNMKIVAEKL